MSKIKLTGDTSGYIEISAPNVAANNTLELGGGTKILTNLDNVFTGVTTYSGNIDLNANLDLDDNNKILIGTGDDIEIFHNGTDSFIRDVGTGSLYIDSTSGEVVLRVNDTENAVVCRQNAEVELYHDGSQKFETTTTGATVTGTLVSGSVTSELDLTAISSSISDTAVDVFVYDTRKDSDGGAWRKRTQHTSWYNETLGTSSRGSRKDFPAVAVIVAETTKITIYDGDDPDLPMWMIFTWSGTGNSALGYDNRAKSAVTMSNGQLVTCSDPDGVHIARFVYDDVVRYTHTGYFKTTSAIAERTGVPHITINTTDVLVASTCNDVAMTVLPNAPIDDTTSLPIPTIAVATDGGLSVIRDDGTVVDITASGYTATDNKIDFDYLNNLLYLESGGFPQRQSIPSSDIIRSAAGGRDRVYGGTSSYVPTMLGTSSNIVTNSDGFLSGSTSGLSILNYDSSQSQEMVAYATTSYNTGWMHGDIKGAFLSDTDTTNVTSGEILTNGDFTNGTTGWTLQDAGEGSISSSSNQLTLNNSTSSDPPVACYQQISLEVGKYYNVTSNKASGLDVVVNITTGTSNGGGTGGYGNVILHNSNGDMGATFLATQATMYCYIRVNTNATGTAVMNFVSIRKAEEDRSINSGFSRDKVSALTINGTITKSAVATGADLVAYSGFSASNNLIQPYNSDLNFGTGDFSVMAWIKRANFNTNHYVFDRNDGSTESDRLAFLINTNGTLSLYSGTTNSQCNSGSILSDADVWRMVMVKRSGGIVTFGVNGVEYSSTTTNGNWATASIDGSGNENFVIGQYGAGTPGNLTFNYTYDIGSIANFRISGSAPSEEQFKKMYNDEKVLFQENAKATLYGSSDAVTALAYDEDTELLHVGTSSGRSDFQGLRRINNTTTAVTTAISASDELIAEQ